MRYIKYFLNVLVVCLFLTGCQKNNGEKDFISGNSESNENVGTVENGHKLRSGGKVMLQLTEGVTLDTVVEMPDINLDAVGLYQVVQDKYDGQKLITALLGSMPENVEVEEWENAERSYRYQGNLGENWRNMDGLVFADEEDAKIETEHWNDISSCFPVEYRTNEILISIDSEAKDDDFSFATRKEASDAAGQYIKKITGFEDVRMYQAYSFNYQQMEKTQKKILNTPDNEQAKSEEGSMRSWKEEDNCYWMFFEQILDGIPVLSCRINRQDDLYIPSNVTEVGYTQNGIEYIRFGRSFEILNDKTVKLVSGQDIYETLRQKFEMAIVEGIIIDQMKLIYYPLPTKKNDEGRWECDMIPAWQFRIREDGYMDYIYINAVDNKEIVG